LRNALVKSETELGWARSALDQAQPLHLRRAAENMPIGVSVLQQQKDEAETTGSNKHALVRDFLVVMAVVVPAILFYPWFAGYLPEDIRSNLATVTGGLLSTGEERPAVPHAAALAAAPVVERPTISLGRSVNVRATPATKGAVLLTLPKGGLLIVLEQSGNWTHVEIPAKDAGVKAQQGWVFSANLAGKKEGGVTGNVKNNASTAQVSKDPAPLAAGPVSADTGQVSQSSGQPATPPANDPPAAGQPENASAEAAQ
jgi:SH3-like domain-containing protein